MAPKKKGGKKAQDDWEADLGETIDATAPKEGDDGQEEGNGEITGGLLAALRKNRGKKAKKGKHIEDFVEGEDPTAELTEEPPPPVTSKQPEEADMDDEDVFGQPVKKGKGVKALKEEKAEEQDAEDEDAGGRVKTKKEKEKEKKEKEKQRKKDLVYLFS